MKAGYFYLILASLMVSFANAQVGPMPQPTNFYTSLVKDVNPGSADSGPSLFAEMGGTLYFTPKTAASGRELWKSDGTSANTLRVKDINPNGDSDPQSLVDFNGTLIFSASNSQYGRELWKSDGTSAGTQLIKDIYPNGSSNPSSFTIIGDKLYFIATNPLNGRELWKTDGTSAGTVLVKDITSGSGNTFGNEEYFLAMNSLLYFATGKEIWKSDGTSAGTSRILLYSYQQQQRNVRLMQVSGQKIYFYASFTDYSGGIDEIPTILLCTSDGQSNTAQTVKVFQNLSPVSSEGTLSTVANGYVFFVAKNINTGAKLYRTNGTTIGTYWLEDLNQDAQEVPFNLVTYKNKAFFGARNGNEIYLGVSDGTLSGTKQVKEASPAYLSVAANRLFFLDLGGVWISDGTTAGTKAIIYTGPGDLQSYTPNFTTVGTRVFYNGRVTTNGGVELYKASPCTACPVAAGPVISASNREAAVGLRLESRGNPVTDEITTEIGASDAGKITLTLTNSAGRILETRILKGEFSEIQTFDVRKYPTGIYLINAANLREQKVLKIVKSR